MFNSILFKALLSIFLIWILTGILVYMAILRVVNNDFEIESTSMLVTASCGVVFNIIMYFILHTNSCFRGVDLKHHGHSHSGDGHGHGHGHEHSNSQNNHGHSHASKFRAKANSNPHSTPINNKNVLNNSLPITDSDYAVSSNSTNVGEVGTAIVIEDCGGKVFAEPLVESDDSNINLRAAAIHVIGDFIQSVGVLIASIIIYFKVIFLSFS